jgi:CDP-diacylglycerol--serine O-phosphatidyltransferase
MESNLTKMALLLKIYLNFKLLQNNFNGMKHIPNLITALNLAAGFIAILFALEGNLVISSWLILAAMIFDFLDGTSARLLKAYSDIGKELDSLADVVSFGVAPALILYSLLCSNTGATISGTNDFLSSLILLTPVIMPVCAGLRLAIFNIDKTQTTTFRGLPVPANALAVISIIIAANYSDSSIINLLTGSSWMIISIILILSVLMVTRIPMISLKFKSLKLKGNEDRYLLIVLVIVAFAVLGIAAAPLIIPVYIIVSLISLAFHP